MVKKAKRSNGNLDAHYDSVLGDFSSVIDAVRKSAARSVNCIMTAAYWLIGRRIVEYEQGGKERARYGEELLTKLAIDLAARFGRGYSRRESAGHAPFLYSLSSGKNLADTVCQIERNEKVRGPFGCFR